MVPNLINVSSDYYHALVFVRHSHIGDFVVSDVNGASAAGITPVLIDRKAKVQCADYKVIHRLTEALEYLE